jgi:hypothetical protein
MTLQVTQSVPANTLTTPSALTPAATDTFASGSFGATGIVLRVITTGTLTSVAIVDPGTTSLGNAGTPASNATPASGSRMLLVPRSAINPATDLASVTFSGTLTGVTYEAYRI